MTQRGFLKILYIFTLSITMFNKLPDISFPWWFKYSHCLLWICIYLYMSNYRVYGSKSNKVNQCILSIQKIFLTPYMLFILFTPLGWLVYIDSLQLNMITRMVSSVIQFLLIAFSVMATASIFREHLIKYTFYAMIINYMVVIMTAILKCGIVDFIQTGLVPFGHAATRLTDELLSVKILEVHDITFAAGFFFIYFCVQYKNIGKHRLLYLFLSILLIYLGYKRIELAALALTIVFARFINTKKKVNIKYWSVVFTIGVLAVMYVFIWIIGSGALKELVDNNGLTLMHREKTYVYMAQFFELSPSYIGRGMAAAIRLNLAGIASGHWMIMGHSDILFSYIDYGFWGFTIWVIYCCYFATKLLLKKFGTNAAKIWMVFTAYAFITYLSDNTAWYYAFQISYMVIMFHVLYTSAEFSTKKNEGTAAIGYMNIEVENGTA